MRWIVGILLIVVWLGWAACQIEAVGHPGGARLRMEDGWRRTVGGWERHVSLPKSAASGEASSIWRSHPHPLVFTSLLILLSMLLLVAFTDDAAFRLSHDSSVYPKSITGQHLTAD